MRPSTWPVGFAVPPTRPSGCSITDPTGCLERPSCWTARDGVWFLAPAERISSSLQSALMVREGPRRTSDGCETGDWSHVDVYLTKTHDYRAVIFTGGRHEAAAADWMRQRGTTALAVGGPFDAAQQVIRYPGDDDPIVSLLTEVLVAELIAPTWWSQSVGRRSRERQRANSGRVPAPEGAGEAERSPVPTIEKRSPVPTIQVRGPRTRWPLRAPVCWPSANDSTPRLNVWR